jgi:uncharacterized membrane protein
MNNKMSHLAFPLSLFIFFKSLQRLIELDDYVARVHAMPNWSWFLRGGCVNDKVKVRSSNFYAFLSWFFLIIIIVSILIPSKDSSDFNLIKTAKGAVVIFVVLAFRAEPYIRNIRGNIKR